MRAFAVRAYGEPPTVQELPIPDVAGAFLVRVTVAGVNPVDYKSLDGLNAQSAYPRVVGIDFAGIVERVPPNEQEIHVGDRVFGEARTYGSYAEYTAVVPGANAEGLTRIPDRISDEEAAALPVPATTALGSLELMGVGADQNVVVMGATGGVGGYAVQIARSRGAHVDATVLGDVDQARRLGANDVYDSASVDAIAALRESHADGVDAVLDLVDGPEAIRRDAEILKKGGKLVSTIRAVDEAWFEQHGITAHNITPKNNPSANTAALDALADMLVHKTITARVARIGTLDDANKIFEALRRGGIHGKAVIRI